MPTPTKGPRLGGSPAHERLILANLAHSLFDYGRVTTTEAKARRLRPVAERLITKAKRGDLHARRQVLSVIRDKGVVHHLFEEIGPRFANRPGGYTRITKIGPRKGDNAPMAVIELVEAVAESPPQPQVANAGVPAQSSARSAEPVEEESLPAESVATGEAADSVVDSAAETDDAHEPDEAESAAESDDAPESDEAESAAAGSDTSEAKDA